MPIYNEHICTHKIVKSTTKAIIPFLYFLFKIQMFTVFYYQLVDGLFFFQGCLSAESFPGDCFYNDFSMQNRYYMHKANTHRYDLWMAHKENIGQSLALHS